MPEVPHTTILSILECLAADLPSFHLPPVTTAHTRHYMPWEKKGPDDRTLVLDSFVATEPGAAVIAIWPNADLTPEQREVLARLLANLSYLGRAESWCEARLVDAPPEANCFPWEDGAMAWYGRANSGAVSPVLSGKAPDGRPLEGHQHAFYLSTDEDDDGHIDHLTVWAPTGLGLKERDALARVNALNPGGGQPELRLAFLAYGDADDFWDIVPIFRRSQVWQSATPFVLNRHMKLRGSGEDKHLVDGPADQVQKELERRPQIGIPAEAVEVAPPLKIRRWRTVYPLEFYRWRRSGSQGGSAFNFRLRFKEPVVGPIALGYACHYGLGLFLPADTREGD